jgi:phage terminase Nu1 subunit (DNA packaging protein)
MSKLSSGEIAIGDRRFLTAGALAAILGVSVRTLARWDAVGIGPPKIKVGNTVLFDVAKLPDWLAEREKAPRSESNKRYLP